MSEEKNNMKLNQEEMEKVVGGVGGNTIKQGFGQMCFDPNILYDTERLLHIDESCKISEDELDTVAGSGPASTVGPPSTTDVCGIIPHTDSEQAPEP